MKKKKKKNLRKSQTDIVAIDENKIKLHFDSFGRKIINPYLMTYMKSTTKVIIRQA